MRSCDKCLKKLAGSKVFHINIESLGMYGQRINSECKFYEICEVCASKVESMLQTSNEQELDK